MDSSAVAVGRIVRAHGLRGEVVVQPASTGSDVLFLVESVLVDHGGKRNRVPIVNTRMQGKAQVLLLEGVKDRTAAEKLVGAQLWLEYDELPAPEEGEYYVDDLIGLEVFSPAGERLGEVVDFEDGGPQSWLVVETAKGRALVPFTEPMVKVDEESERVILDAPEGLLDPETAVKA